MSTWTIIVNSLRFYWRTHLGVMLGAAVSSAILVGALVVGDSVRFTLHRMALGRLGGVDGGGIHVAMHTGDRFFTTALGDKIAADLKAPQAPALSLSAVGSVQGSGAARAPGVHVIGVDDQFWKLAGLTPMLGPGDDDAVVINRRLADRLGAGVGDVLVLRVAKPSALSRDIALGSQNEQSIVLTPKVKAIAGDDQFGRFSLQANQVPPLNAFVPLSVLQTKAQVVGQANMLLLGAVPGADDELAAAAAADTALHKHWTLADVNVELRPLPALNVLELRSSRVFIDPPIAEAAAHAGHGAQQALTYFVNAFKAANGSVTPYSMVTALSPPGGAGLTSPLPADMADNEIVINQWLATDGLQVAAGDDVTLTYWVMGPARTLKEESATFKVRAIVPTEGAGDDRELMPAFPGLTDADTPLKWKPPADLHIDLGRIKPKDEQYWKDHRGAPKAFVTLNWAHEQGHWNNVFGNVTSLRWPLAGHDADALGAAIRAELDPAKVGLFFLPVRQQALVASGKGTGAEFGWLFIGLSFFIIVAALLLTGLLFAFEIDTRAEEVGTLLAVGLPPKRVRRMLLCEGAVLAAVGGVAGAAAGLAYTQVVLRGLAGVWQGAVAAADLRFHAEPATLLGGCAAGILVALGAIWFGVRRQAKSPARQLLAGSAESGAAARPAKRGLPWGVIIAVLAIVSAVAMVAMTGIRRDQQAAETFFSAGSMLLIGGILLARWLLMRMARSGSTTRPSLGGLGVRNAGRRRGRSLATAAMLACATFLIFAIGAFYQDASADADKRSSGTGGFAFFAQSTLPVLHDLNTPDGAAVYALDPDDMRGVSVAAMRVLDGDDASCLNLNRAVKPRLVGLVPQDMASRGAFTFTKTIKDTPDPWLLLGEELDDETIPAIGDEQTVMWGLGTSVGGTVDYTDERGRTFKVQIVGTVRASILQGSLFVSQAQFTSRFPSTAGFRMFLIDVKDRPAGPVGKTLADALADVGFDITPAVQRLADFNAVQNTYLTIFQALGGLGLLLGSVGLGVVVLRNILERRSELALLRAVGLRRGALHWLLLSEHWLLLAMGLGIGLIAAAVAVLPALLTPGAPVPYGVIAVTLGAVVASGLLWTWLATLFALRGPLLNALRNE